MYLVEAGLVLTVTPWTQLWGRNFFVYTFPGLEPLLVSFVVRGAVSGLGVVSLTAALVEIWCAARAWHRHRVAGQPRPMLSPTPDLPASELPGEVCPPSS